MPHNRLSVLFDRKPRHSKSTSNLSGEFLQDYQPEQTEWKVPRKPISGEVLTVMHEYRFGRAVPPPPATRPPASTSRQIAAHRSSTAPVLHPPDELFLSMIRRRSASARLEETRVEHEEHQKHDPELAMSLAIASALPPIFFDAPPEYTSPESVVPMNLPPSNTSYDRPVALQPSPHLGSKGTISKFKEDELFLEDPLRLQIDETIAQFASFRLTQPTPVTPPQEPTMLVSPMNEIDHLYLERRRQKRRQQRIVGDTWDPSSFNHR